LRENASTSTLPIFAGSVLGFSMRIEAFPRNTSGPDCVRLQDAN
jgi:hypothetical protein